MIVSPKKKKEIRFSSFIIFWEKVLKPKNIISIRIIEVNSRKNCQNKKIKVCYFPYKNNKLIFSVKSLSNMNFWAKRINIPFTRLLIFPLFSLKRRKKMWTTDILFTVFTGNKGCFDISIKTFRHLATATKKSSNTKEILASFIPICLMIILSAIEQRRKKRNNMSLWESDNATMNSAKTWILSGYLSGTFVWAFV